MFRGLLGALFVLAAASAGPRPRLVATLVVAITPFFGAGGDDPTMLATGATVALSIDCAVRGARVHSVSARPRSGSAGLTPPA